MLPEGKKVPDAMPENVNAFITSEEQECRRTHDLIDRLLKLSSVGNTNEFYGALVKELAKLLQFDHVFIAHALDQPPTRVRVQASWNRGEFRKSWDYELEGNPCLIPYDGEATLIPCDITKIFETKKNFSYESFVGVPLKDADGEIYGHLALYGDRTIDDGRHELEIAKLFANRAQTEARRLDRESKMYQG